MTFNISPDGTYRGIPGEPAHNFCMTYSSLMRLRRYRNFWDLVRPINENTENTAAELSKLLTLFWRQTTTWYSNGQEKEIYTNEFNYYGNSSEKASDDKKWY